MARNSECIEERKTTEGISYKVHIPYTDELGIRRFYSKSFSEKKYGTKAKALEFAKKHRDEIKVKIANDSIIKVKKYTLEQVYTESMNLYQCSINTKRKYDCYYREYILKVVDKDRDFKSIKFIDIQTSLNNMTTKVSNDSIKRCYALWKRLYRYAIASDIVYRDETIKVEVPKSEVIIKKKDMRTSLDEVMEIIKTMPYRVNNPRYAMMYKNALLIMYYTGMRPSEVFALEESNIDLYNERCIYVCQRIGSNSTEKICIARTKTEESIRRIPISNELYEPIKELIDNSIDGYLFKRDNGNFINGSEFSSIMSHLTEGKFRAYSLRHQFSTDLIASGSDLRTIQELMGHKSSSMTLSYARSNEQLKINAINSRTDMNNIIDCKIKVRNI